MGSLVKNEHVKLSGVQSTCLGYSPVLHELDENNFTPQFNMIIHRNLPSSLIRMSFILLSSSCLSVKIISLV